MKLGTKNVTKEHNPQSIKYPNIRDIIIPMVPLLEFTDIERYYSVWSNSERSIPDDLIPLRDKKVEALIARNAKATNNEALALNKFITTPNSFTAYYEPTHYFSFVGTHLALDEKLQSGLTVRQKFGDLEEMVTEKGYTSNQYAKMVGVSNVILTNDNKIILQQRSQKTAVVPGQMHVSLAEGMKKKDVDNKGYINPLITAKRGMREELESDKENSESKVLALGISREFLQPEFVVLTEINQSSKDLLKIAQKARGQWERFSISAENFDLQTIENLLKENIWSPHAQFALYEVLKAKKLL